MPCSSATSFRSIFAVERAGEPSSQSVVFQSRSRSLTVNTNYLLPLSLAHNSSAFLRSSLPVRRGKSLLDSPAPQYHPIRGVQSFTSTYSPHDTFSGLDANRLGLISVLRTRVGLSIVVAAGTFPCANTGERGQIMVPKAAVSYLPIFYDRSAPSTVMVL